MLIPSFCSMIKFSGKKCLSTNNLNVFEFRPPERADPIFLSICQDDSNLILGSLLAFDRAKLTEISEKQEERRKIVKMYSNEAIIGLKENDQMQKLKEQLRKIRFDNCRYCNHDLECKCQICKNTSDSKYVLFVSTHKNTFRHSFHLHIKCAHTLMSRLGYQSKLEIRPLQTTL